MMPDKKLKICCSCMHYILEPSEETCGETCRFYFKCRFELEPDEDGRCPFFEEEEKLQEIQL